MSPFKLKHNKRRRRRVRSGSEDRRATALHLAGLELLAQSDFENVSIAKITKMANCSVGTFYYRYKDKNVYLRQLISVTFRTLENSLQNRLSNSAGRISISEFISHIIEKLSTRENIGIIRAALKLGATHYNALRPYEEYRKRVTSVAVNIFKGGSKKNIRATEIREAVQILFSAINDAALMPNSAAIELGSEGMANTICEFAASHIGVKPNFMGRISKTTVITGNKPDEILAMNKMEVVPIKKKPAKRVRRKVSRL